MRKALSFLYGVVAYLFFLAVFAYAIGFVENLLVPTSLDAGSSPLPGPPLLVDLGLLALFAVQHSGMARRGFKERWTRVLSPHVERSTYVLAASAVLAVVMWGWKPMPAPVWTVQDPIAARGLQALSFLGWGTVLLATFLIDHFHLFGLKQVWGRLRGREIGSPSFSTPFLYRYVRHPLYLGFMVAFWATPRMTTGHLLFAATTTAWMLLAIQLEERDLLRFHGRAYREYRERVAMLLPLPRRSEASAPDGEPEGEGAAPGELRKVG